MEPMTEKEKQLELLRKNLPSIRKLLGWSQEQLAERLGVTPLTVGNLENGKTKLTVIHYIAIRTIVEHEAEVGKDEALEAAIRALLEPQRVELGHKFDDLHRFEPAVIEPGKAYGDRFEKGTVSAEPKRQYANRVGVRPDRVGWIDRITERPAGSGRGSGRRGGGT